MVIYVKSNPRKGRGFEDESLTCDICERIATKYICIKTGFDDVCICRGCLWTFNDAINESILRDVK